MKNKKLFVLIPVVALLLCAAFIFTACSGGGGNDTPKSVLTDYISGKNNYDAQKIAGTLYVKGYSEYNKYIKDNEIPMKAAKQKDKTLKTSIKMSLVSFDIIVETNTTATAKAIVKITAKVYGYKLPNSTETITKIRFDNIDGKWYLKEDTFKLDLSAIVDIFGGLFGV